MITELTPSQQARFAEFRDKWLAIGLSTDPADRLNAEQGVIDAYRVAGLQPPKRIVWCGSPLSNGLTRAIVFGLKPSELKSLSVRDSVRDSVWASVWASDGQCLWLDDDPPISLADTITDPTDGYYNETRKAN